MAKLMRFLGQVILAATGLVVMAAGAFWALAPRLSNCPPQSAARTQVLLLRRSIRDLLQAGVVSCDAAARQVAEREGAETLTDHWGNRYRIDCSGDEVRVWSPGPDRAWATDDDVAVPDRPSDDTAAYPGPGATNDAAASGRDGAELADASAETP